MSSCYEQNSDVGNGHIQNPAQFGVVFLLMQLSQADFLPSGKTEVSERPFSFVGSSMGNVNALMYYMKKND